MHSVPVDEKAKEEDKLWTYRWREWLPITEEEYTSLRKQAVSE